MGLDDSKETDGILYEVLRVQEEKEVILDSSMVEHTAVNRGVVGSSPTRGVFQMVSGPMVKRLRHRPFTAVTRVRFSLGSLRLSGRLELVYVNVRHVPMWLNWQSS